MGLQLRARAPPQLKNAESMMPDAELFENTEWTLGSCKSVLGSTDVRDVS